MGDKQQEIKPDDKGNGNDIIDEPETIESLTAKIVKKDDDISALKKLNEDVTKAQSGVDSSNTQLRKTIEILEKEKQEREDSLKTKMSDEEKLRLEIKNLTDGFSKLQEQTAKDKLHAFKLEKMAEIGVNLNDQRFIIGSSEEAIISEIEAFKKNRDEELKVFKEKAYEHGSPQKGVKDASGMTQKDFDLLTPSEATAMMKTNPEVVQKFLDKKMRR